MRRAALTLAVLSALVGCTTTGMDPAKDLSYSGPQAWATSTPATTVKNDSSSDIRWWTRFGDPVLVTLVDKALAGSPTLAQANSRIDQARANARVSRTSLGPSVTLGGYHTTQDSVNSRGASFDARWELDFTGKKAMASSAALHRYYASDAAYKSARTRLSAEVASVYFDLRNCEHSVALATEALASRKKTLALVEVKVHVGAAAKTTLYQVQAGVAEAENSVAAQLGSCSRLKQQLVAITTLSSEELAEALGSGTEGYMPNIETVSFSALPADIVRQRPDIAELEQKVLAYAQEVGVAAAERLPSVSLGGSIGWTALGGASSWSWGPQVSLPIFDGGRIKFGHEKAVANYEESVSAWKAGVITAIHEVEDSLIRLDVVRRQVVTANFALSRYTEVFEAAEVRYDAGAASLLELEDARRSALEAKQARVSLTHEYVQARIALYKAAGGAWANEPKDIKE